MPISAGQLRERFAFDGPTEVDDGYGGVVAGFGEQFSVAARRQYLRGGEAVQAARLQGKQPVILTVRRSSQTEAITTQWRARDARTGEVFNIRSIEPSEDRSGFDILAEAGVAI
ncbi:head-tail adaptor protein [Aureimonas glaciei]|uniref:Head-tail adaptor protein n=1 Tax=Aureimonas glaciei TaxID=1776957 RepID=A0A916Y4R1_9HYPH|nr:head-tail adaptor protein [Aureimonas glaciei]GGD30797.1 hypothetical protein GCM10011335_37270 [Aureimonas glaciei]